MRNMSFALTTEQMRARPRRKRVTRRIGWTAAKAGDLAQPVVKGMGLRKGEKVERINPPIRFISVRREQIRRMTDDLEYGRAEVIAEGFPDLTPAEFVAMLCSKNRCRPDRFVTRIEFVDVEGR